MAEKKKNIIEKQPVVVLVGHIDHGKSSILSKIRDFKITEKEVGGITQHVGAYEVVEGDKKITFIDTPGHEAFNAMRARGATVADIAVLVVAADDGVKPQTKEAIAHIQKAGIPMVVAINKIDISRADAERVKDELSQNKILVESRGGDVPCVKTSAKTGKGIAELLQMILLVAEMKELKSDISAPAEGVVIESFLDNKRGPMATLILEQGILKRGDIVGTDSCLGKFKRMEDFIGNEIKEAMPGQGILALGFEKMPVVGEKFRVYSDLESARQAIKPADVKTLRVEAPKLEPQQKILNIVLKTDVLGSIEPVENVIKALPKDKVMINIMKAAAGNVNLSDIKLAETSNALIIAFRVKADSAISEIADKKKIKILSFDLIYDLVEGIRNSMKRSLSVEKIRVDLGKLKVLVVFKTDKKRQVIGAKVIEGEIRKGLKLEVLRLKEAIGKGKIISLQKDKKELGKGVKGDEVGILYEGDVKVQEDDILVAHERRTQEAEL